MTRVFQPCYRFLGNWEIVIAEVFLELYEPGFYLEGLK